MGRGDFYSYSPYESILNNFLCLEQTWISDWHKNINDREPERLCGPWYIYRRFVKGHYKPGVRFSLLIAYLYFTGRSWYADISETTFNVLHMGSWLWGWSPSLSRIILENSDAEEYVWIPSPQNAPVFNNLQDSR